MATNTAKLGLTKPGYSDTADIQVLNDNFDDIDSALGGMSIIINGNKTSYSSGASIGQYVTLINSTIVDSGDVMLPDGVYTAAKAIPYNTAIDKTYLTAVAGGALNALNSKIADQAKHLIIPSSSSQQVISSPSHNYMVFGVNNSKQSTFGFISDHFGYTLYTASNGAGLSVASDGKLTIPAYTRCVMIY